MIKLYIIKIIFVKENEMSKEELQKKYEGKVIKIINMPDTPSYNGKVGTVEYVDDMNQLHGTWGGCAVIPEVDDFEIIQE